MDAIENVAGLNYHGSDGLIYSFNGSAFTVSGNDELEGEVSIPSSVFYQDKYYPVVAIAANAFSGSKITKAEIASSVETVGEKAFYASTLTSVKFYGSASIGANAFYAGRVAFSVPKEYLSAYESSLASYKKTLVGFDTIANNALNIAALFRDKVDKIIGESANERAYII
ncbi:MAG: leucine-rich repeat protein, partial [Alistipes sp.]|nr:leucine-rich repeat protein [Alistipes sp.]